VVLKGLALQALITTYGQSDNRSQKNERGMNLLPRRSILGLAAVVDIAIHSDAMPVAAKALARRLNLPPRHLEPLLQALVRANILRGVRGPRGGYELTKERRNITACRNQH
jgi:Rrf2 family iron-sulfur cluster assembly transcriptional regulator